MKPPYLLLNLTWLAIALAVAAGAYILGRNREDAASLPAGDAAAPRPRESRVVALRPDAPATTPLIEGREGPAARPAVYRETTGNAFIDSLLAAGGPVSAEAMSRAIAEAFGEADSLKRNMMFAQLVKLLTPENAQASVEAFDELPRGFEQYNHLSLFRFAWGKLDGQAAATYATGLSGKSKEYSIASVMSGWASQDPEAAIAWVNALQDEGDLSRFSRGLVQGLAKTDPDLATAFALEKGAAGDKRVREYISEIAREQVNRNITSAISWAENLPENSLKESALERIGANFVEKDPEQAAAWARQYAGTGYGANVIGEVADEWAEKDPVSAVSWVASLPEGDERRRAFREAIWEWTESDPYAASEYVSAMAAGADRDAAITSLSRRHVYEDPEAAIAWAGSISDGELRLKTIADTGQAWMSRDPKGASVWLESSGLPEDIRTRIANPQRHK